MPNANVIKLKEKVRCLSRKPGVYLLKDRLGSILYVGKAKDLKKRVSTYFQPSRRFAIQQPKVAAMLDLIADIEVIEVKSEAEALLLEGRCIKQWKPKYNTDFVDDKRFFLIRVDARSDLPCFRLTRLRTDPQSRYFGPFAHAGMLRKTLAEMRLKFGILLGDAQPKRLADGRYRLYEDARAEIYGHSNEVTLAEYRMRIESACTFLEGKTREWLGELENKMEAAAADHEYEKAAELRDLVQALKETTSKTRKFERGHFRKPIDPTKTLSELRDLLDLPVPPRRMECFDISHISGTFLVASMVCFINGVADKNHYRRFRIKGFIGNDDFRAMEEVVGRRYRRLKEEGKPFPDLVVIDGGKGQVSAALRAFLILGLDPPPIIGLAKENETLIFADERRPLNLPLHNPALQLLQRLRDESHRFANTYNAELRSRRIGESILDDFRGLGPVRKAALRKRFKSIQHLRRATEEELVQVEGIGPSMARRLIQFFLESQ